MNSLFCNYENCKYLHLKRIRNNNQNLLSGQSSQMFKEQISTRAQNIRNNSTPRMNLFNNPPCGYIQQPEKPLLEQEN